VARRIMTVVPTLLREALEPREPGEAPCLPTDGLATGCAPCRANAYLCRTASRAAPAAAKQCEQSLFLVRLDRPSDGANRFYSVAQNEQLVTRQVDPATKCPGLAANQPEELRPVDRIRGFS